MRPRRNFGSNKLDGTIPAALSALNLLTRLCARRARDAALGACDTLFAAQRKALALPYPGKLPEGPPPKKSFGS